MRTRKLGSLERGRRVEMGKWGKRRGRSRGIPDGREGRVYLGTDGREGWRGELRGIHRKGIPMITLAMRNAVGPYNPLARSLIMEDRSSKYAGIYATAYDR